MKKSGKRMVSFILTAVMVFALLPVIGNPMVVKAEDTPAEHVAHDEQCSAEKTDCEHHKGWETISTEKELMELGETGGSGYLVDNIQISEAFEIKEGVTVNLCLNGYSITQTADVYTIRVCGTLNLYDKKDNSGKITHSEGKNGCGVCNYYGTFVMEGGTISENHDYTAGEAGGVYNHKGPFIMKGGIISGNEASFGSGVTNFFGSFTMEGGIISGNDAYTSGVVENTQGTFTMKGGIISGNEADDSCGVANSGTFIMEGGIISGNRSIVSTIENYFDGTFTKIGGYIGDNVEGRSVSSYTVTYNPNGGSGQAFSQIAPANQNVKLIPNEYELYGKAFEGWNTEPYGTGESFKDNATINRTDNLIIYCQWKDLAKISHEITFEVNNGTWADGTNDKKTVTVWRFENEDKTLNLEAKDIPNLADPATGYKGSWDTEPDTENALTDNKTYTYTFEPIKYTVKYDANGGEGTMDDQGRTYDDKTALTTNKFTFEGKTFNGWNTAADGSGTHYANEEVNNISSKDGDIVTLYAQWTIDTFTITWKDYDGTVLETDSDVAYGATPEYNGETPKRDDTANIKYTFAGWTPEIDTVKGATTYTAAYSEEEIVEPTEPTTPEDPREPGTEDLTDPEPDPEIPDEDWLDDLRLQLRIADELGGPRTVTYSGDFALSYDIMLYLVEHPDITFIYTVTYEDVEYTITIPAGKAIADPEIPWYGPLWLLANYGN